MAEGFDKQLAKRLSAIAERYRRGLDVPPALRHRCEGFAAAGLALGLIQRGEIDALCENIGEPLAWRWSEQGELEIAAAMVRAPVYPSTK